MPKITACIWNLEENTNELFNSRSQYYGKTLQTVNEFDHPGAHTMKANESWPASAQRIQKERVNKLCRIWDLQVQVKMLSLLQYW